MSDDLPRPAPAFSLPNVGPGPDPCSLSDLAAESEFVVLFFQRDHHCTNCRSQVQAVADHIGEFRARDAAVASILPESPDRARLWQDRYELPYPLLADPEATAGAAYDQPVRFGFLGSWSDFIGRMPAVVIVDAREDPRIVWTHRGSSTFDRPDVADVLDALEEVAARPPADGTTPGGTSDD